MNALLGFAFSVLLWETGKFMYKKWKERSKKK